MKKQIPNILTLLNLFSGCIAITMAFQHNFMAVVIWVAIAALFDFLDGAAARLLNAWSPIGKELDSLADLVSFGVAPAATLFMLLRDQLLLPGFLEPAALYMPYLAFLIPAFSAYRLAKFNLDERQTTSFLGLPTPANGLFWISYTYGLQKLAVTNENLFYLTTALILIFSWLMISEIPMFSLKIKSLRLKGNVRPAILVLLMILFMVFRGILGIAGAIVAYILLSLLTPVKGVRNR
ncbi:MAG: CDP-diacylglycerol--serine O-phosphatidyltransferase [Bacteroidales bacterium]|jgi:CDP-diacylglycerol--serine O-phosphatidyltransferase|nr:CDP-diacylglycerol--serine O-phosphatidyltransferase [Bacteroidales bacterium]